MTSASHSLAHQPFARHAGHWLLLIATVAMVALGLGARLATAPAETAGQATAQVSLAASPPVLARIGASGATGCWVAGDMVGEGNPADVARALCGIKS